MTPDDAPAQAASIIRTTQLEQLLLYLQGVAAPHCQTFFFVRRHKYIHSCKPAGGAHSTPRLWCTLQVTFLTRCFSADSLSAAQCQQLPPCCSVSAAVSTAGRCTCPEPRLLLSQQAGGSCWPCSRLARVAALLAAGQPS